MSGLNNKEIETLYKKGKRLYTTFFKVFFLSSNELKVAIVVSKKISKKAVVRNKIKRRLRHLSRENLKSGLYVIVVKEDVSKIEFDKLRDDFKKIVNKVS